MLLFLLPLFLLILLLLLVFNICRLLLLVFFFLLFLLLFSSCLIYPVCVVLFVLHLMCLCGCCCCSSSSPSHCPFFFSLFFFLFFIVFVVLCFSFSPSLCVSSLLKVLHWKLLLPRSLCILRFFSDVKPCSIVPSMLCFLFSFAPLHQKLFFSQRTLSNGFFNVFIVQLRWTFYRKRHTGFSLLNLLQASHQELRKDPLA